MKRLHMSRTGLDLARSKATGDRDKDGGMMKMCGAVEEIGGVEAADPTVIDPARRRLDMRRGESRP